MEILTAIALMTILIGMAVPSFTGLRGPYLTRQTAQQIATEFQKARMRAIAANARYQLTYNASTKVYTVSRENSSGSNTWTAEYSGQLPTGASINSLATAPIFDTRGTLNQAVTITVTAQGYPNTRTVDINVLGKVTIS